MAKKALRLLPAPPESPTEVKAKQLFGITVRPATSGSLNFVPLSIWNGSYSSAVCVHKTPRFLEPFTYEYYSGSEKIRDTVPGLFNIFSHLSDPGQGVTFLLRALKTNLEEIYKRVRNIAKYANPAYKAYLTTYLDWVNPKTDGQGISHDLLVWGPENDFIPVATNEDTAALNASTLVPYQTAGTLIREVLYRKPISGTALRPDPISGRIDPLAYAAPRQVVKDYRYVAIENVAYSYWVGHELTLESLGPLLSSDLDILLHIRQVGQYFYQTVVLRTETKRNALAKLDDFTEVLNARFGKWERLTGDDLWTAFKSFVPGSKPLPQDWSFSSIPNFRPFFTALAESIKPASDFAGDLTFGKNGTIKGGSYVVRSQRSPKLISGASKISGKTTVVAAASLAYSPPFWTPLTSTAGDSYAHWTTLFGGQLVNLNLPDAHILLADEARARGKTPSINKTVAQERQEELQTQDAIEAQNLAWDVLEMWAKYGRSVGLPLAFNPMTESIRVLNFYHAFWEAMLRENGHQQWFGKTGTTNLAVFDNFYHLQKIIGSGSEGPLGRLPVNVAELLAQTIGGMVNNGANGGLETWVVTQDPSDLNVISPGFYSHFALHVSLGHNDRYEQAWLVLPNGKEIVTQDLNIHLPWPIIEVVGRRELANPLLQSEGDGIEQLVETNSF